MLRLGLPFLQIIGLVLLKDFPGFLVKLLEFGDLRPLLLPLCKMQSGRAAQLLLNLGKLLLCDAPAAYGAGRAGNQRLICRHIPVVLYRQGLQPGLGVCQRLGVL